MIDIGFFYLLLLILLLVLLFIIILYTGGHSRTIAPPLMNSFYGVSMPTSTSIDATWRSLELMDGGNFITNGVSGGFRFGSNGEDTVPFSFEPLTLDRQRNLNGKLLILAETDGVSRHFSLRLKDTADNNIVADSTNFVLYPGAENGLQKIELIFNAKQSSSPHNFSLEALARAPTTSIPGTSILINSAYFTYI